MPHTVKVIRGPEFIRAQPEGRVDLATAEQLLTRIVEAGTGLENYQVLIDIRHISGQLEPGELWKLAEKAAKHGRTLGDRTAILCPLERFDKTRFFALCVEHRGVNIHAFTDYEAAMEWLITADGPRAA